MDAFSCNEALGTLSRVICYGSRAIRSAQMAALESFLSLPTHRLTYSSFASAEQALRQLAG